MFDQDISEEIKKFSVNPFLWLVPLILSGIGILVITSTTSPTSFVNTGTPFQMGIKQLTWLGIAMLGMYVVYRIPLRFWHKYSGIILVLMWLFAWVPLAPGVGEAIGGARRWVRLPGLGMSIQPGELLCLAVALHVSKLLSREKAAWNKFQSFCTVAVLTAICAVPLLAQPDLGTTVLVFAVAMGIYVERVCWRYPIVLGGITLGIGLPLLIWLEPYRMRRVTAFLNPWSDPLNKGYQAIQGLIAFSNGGMWGMGLGHGFQKLNYLPAAYTDFIFAAVGEELGFAGTLCVLGLFAFWFAQTRVTYFRTGSAFEAALTWGIALTVILPLAINVAGVTKMIPLTGMALPFLSYGGTSLVTMWARVGMLLRLEKESRMEADAE